MMRRGRGSSLICHADAAGRGGWDDHRVISGIVHMLQSGARWRDCPPEYGPYTTVYNRFNRWSRQGVWTGIFKALTGHTGIWTGDAAIDSTSIKAHRSAGGAKGGPSSRA